MADDFESYAKGITAPATIGAAITPHDTNTLANTSRAIWVGGAGDLVVEFLDNPGTAITLVGIPAGTLLPIRVNIIKVATTATSIVALS